MARHIVDGCSWCLWLICARTPHIRHLFTQRSDNVSRAVSNVFDIGPERHSRIEHHPKVICLLHYRDYASTHVNIGEGVDRIFLVEKIIAFVLCGAISSHLSVIYLFMIWKTYWSCFRTFRGPWQWLWTPLVAIQSSLSGSKLCFGDAYPISLPDTI